MKRMVRVALVFLGAALACGCSDDGKKADPRPADGSTPDPNVGPDRVGEGAAPAKGKKAQGAVKGE